MPIGAAPHVHRSKPFTIIMRAAGARNKVMRRKINEAILSNAHRPAEKCACRRLLEAIFSLDAWLVSEIVALDRRRRD